MELIFHLHYVWVVSDIPFSNAARNLGVIFDSQLALKELVNKLWQLAYLEIRRVGLIRHYLSFESSNTLLSSLVLSRLDYCNALLAGSQVLLDKIQRVISCSAQLIRKAPKFKVNYAIIWKFEIFLKFVVASAHADFRFYIVYIKKNIQRCNLNYTVPMSWVKSGH